MITITPTRTRAIDWPWICLGIAGLLALLGGAARLDEEELQVEQGQAVAQSYAEGVDEGRRQALAEAAAAPVICTLPGGPR